MKAEAAPHHESSMLTVRRAALLAPLLFGCGSQAGEGYLGEPLLSMQGQATVSAPTGGEAIVPALCFSDDESLRMSLGMKSAALDHLPPNIEQDLRSDQYVGTEPPWPYDHDHLMHIVDVESAGEFPAEFKVDVYTPPPEAALSRPTPGEPRMATGHVCAVKRDHRGKTHLVQFHERYRCRSEPLPSEAVPMTRDEQPRLPTDCYIRMLWMVSGSDRYYTERYECPDGVSNYKDCTLALKQGDATLKLETWAEDVLGAAERPTIVYLDSPAAPGTRAAWVWGASKTGLAAGYHLFGDIGEVLPAWQHCFPTDEEVVAELAPEFRNDADLVSIIRSEPRESFALTWQQALAQSEASMAAEMKKCPHRPGPPPAKDASLTIEISPKPRTSYGPPPELSEP